MYGNNCQIPDIDPYTKDVMKLIKKEYYEPCLEYPPLTTIEQNFETDTVRVIFHANLIPMYLPAGQSIDTCSYREVSRAGAGNESDFNYK